MEFIKVNMHSQGRGQIFNSLKGLPHDFLCVKPVFFLLQDQSPPINFIFHYTMTRDRIKFLKVLNADLNSQPNFITCST